MLFDPPVTSPEVAKSRCVARVGPTAIVVNLTVSPVSVYDLSLTGADVFLSAGFSNLNLEQE